VVQQIEHKLVETSDIKRLQKSKTIKIKKINVYMIRRKNYAS